MTNSVSSATDKKRTISAFFAGVGGIELGFKQTGEFRVVYANEFDKNAQITYAENNPETPLDKRDIHDVQSTEVPYADVIMGGFPCQAFSIAGYRKGFEDDRGDLFFELLRIIKDNQPETVFVENVKNLVSHDHGRTFKVIREALAANGYYLKWKVLNGKDHGNIPQNRERIYLVGFKNKEVYDNFSFPEEVKLTTKLQDIINFSATENVAAYGKTNDERYAYYEGKQPFYEQLEEAITSQETVYQWRRQYVRENKSGVVPTLTANMGTGGHNVPLILTDEGKIRKLTPKETFNAQGYPKEFKLPDISNGQLYKEAGNSVVVPVIKRIAENIVTALDSVAKDETAIDNVADTKYALVYADIEGRSEGESYVAKYSNSREELEDYVRQQEAELLDDDQYLKLVQKNKNDKFYMIIEI
ncbi:DNA (cytosine-5-)-methyltransferase [Ligilactobacillus equi]